MSVFFSISDLIASRSLRNFSSDIFSGDFSGFLLFTNGHSLSHTLHLKNFSFDVIRLSSTSNEVLHFKHFSNILFNLNNLLLYNKNYVFPNN